MAHWNRLKNVEVKCPGCGNSFWAKPLKHNAQKFCSSDCYDQHRPKRNKETKLKMSQNIRAALADPLIRAKISNAKKGKPRPDLRGTTRSPEIIRRISATRALRISQGLIAIPSGWGNQGEYTSTKTGQVERYHSHFELRRMKALDASTRVTSWTKKHGIRLEYGDHNYVPDFLIVLDDGSCILEEVKGWIADPEVFAQKNQAAKMYCLTKNWTYRVIWKDDLDTVL